MILKNSTSFALDFTQQISCFSNGYLWVINNETPGELECGADSGFNNPYALPSDNSTEIFWEGAAHYINRSKNSILAGLSQETRSRSEFGATEDHLLRIRLGEVVNIPTGLWLVFQYYTSEISTGYLQSINRRKPTTELLLDTSKPLPFDWETVINQ